MLDKVKFSLKHITRREEKPGDKASTDDESMKMPKDIYCPKKKGMSSIYKWFLVLFRKLLISG